MRYSIEFKAPFYYLCTRLFYGGRVRVCLNFIDGTNRRET